MAIASLDMLHDAISMRVPAMLAFTIDGRTLCFPSRFIQGDQDAFCITEPSEVSPLADLLIRGNAAVMMAFRSQEARVMLTTMLLGREGRPSQEPEVGQHWLRLAYPTELEAVQRRAFYRVHVSENSGLQIRVWKMHVGDSLRQLPKPSAELAALASDLSVSGLKATFLPRAGVPLSVTLRDRLRVELRYKGQELLVEARICSLRNDILSGSLVAGVQFTSTSQDLKWNQACQRIATFVGHLQRQELHLLWDGLEQQTSSKPAA
jgi:hypothetical protein